MNGLCTTGIAASPGGEQGSKPAPREQPGSAGRQQPEASAPKRVIDPDNREDPALDREHRGALGCLGHRLYGLHRD